MVVLVIIVVLMCWIWVGEKEEEEKLQKAVGERQRRRMEFQHCLEKRKSGLKCPTSDCSLELEQWPLGRGYTDVSVFPVNLMYIHQAAREESLHARYVWLYKCADHGWFRKCSNVASDCRTLRSNLLGARSCQNLVRPNWLDPSRVTGFENGKPRFDISQIVSSALSSDLDEGVDRSEQVLIKIDEISAQDLLCQDCKPDPKSASIANRREPKTRRAVKLGDRTDVLRRDKHTCQHCGAKAPDVELQVDHKVPVSRGGKNDLGNLQTLCIECNLGKGNRYLD
jgi:hypothetical protein